MTKQCPAFVASMMASAAAMASLGLRVDMYDAPADGATVENDPLLVVLDVLIATNPSSQTWTAGGVRVEMFNSAVLRYAIDPNTGLVVPTNQGSANRFTTSFSKPRVRDSNARFQNSGAAAAGRYTQPPTPLYLPGEFNVAYFASPPETLGSPSSTVGHAVLRFAIDLSATGHVDADVVIKEPDGNAQPPDPAHPVLLARSYTTKGSPGTASATFQDPVTTGHNWSLWATPEPTTFALLAVSAAFAFRRR